jgi:hypothetical protein
LSRSQPQQHDDATPASGLGCPQLSWRPGNDILPPPGLSTIDRLLWRYRNETTDPDPEPKPDPNADPRGKDFRCAPIVPVRRQARVIVPVKSKCGPGSMFAVQMDAYHEKPAEDRAVLNRKAFARKAEAEEKEAERIKRENVRIEMAALRGIVLLPKPKKEKKAKKPKKEKTRQETLDDERMQKHFFEGLDLAIQHFTHGFTHEHARDGQACGEIIADFSEVLEIQHEDGVVEEVYKRTQVHPFFAYFNSIMPRAHNLLVGRDKGLVKRMACKGLAQFQPYTTQGTNGIYGVLAVELDGDYEAFKTLCGRLSKILPPEMMPTFAVGRWVDDVWIDGVEGVSVYGKLARPHIEWALAEPVYWNPVRMITYKSGRTIQIGEPTHVEGSSFHKAKLLMERVGRGLTKLLLDLGADPAQTNKDKFKNPLSTYMSVAVINGDNLHRLQDFRKIPGFDMDVQFGDLQADAEAKAEAKGTAPSLVSQPEFVDTVRETSFVLNNARQYSDQSYLKARSDKVDLERWIIERTMPEISRKWGNSRKVQRLVRGSAKRFATTHDPVSSRPGAAPEPVEGQPKNKRVRRGRFRKHHANVPPVNPDGVRMTWTAREARMRKLQGMAGTETSTIRHGQTMWEVGKHLMVWRSQGMVMNKTAIIKRLDAEKILCDSTAYKRWDEVEAILRKGAGQDSAAVLSCKRGVVTSLFSSPLPSSKTAYPDPSSASDAPLSGATAHEKPDPAAAGPVDEPHKSDDRAVGSDGTAEHEPPRDGTRTVTNIGEGRGQSVYMFIKNVAWTDFAQAA